MAPVQNEFILEGAVEQHSTPRLNRRTLQSSAFQIPKHTEVQNCTNKNNPQSSAEQENYFIFPVEKCFGETHFSAEPLLAA